MYKGVDGGDSRFVREVKRLREKYSSGHFENRLIPVIAIG